MVKNVFSRIDLSSFVTGTTEHTWQPTLSAETNIPSYWLNWRFFVCAIFILTSMFLSSFLIWKYEGPVKHKAGDHREPIGVVYDDENWNTCVARIHPNWLLVGIMQLGALVSIYRYKSGENCLNGVRTVDEELGSYRPPVNSNVFKSSNGTQHVYSSNCIDIGLHSSDSFPSKCETTRLAHSEPSSQPCRASTLTLHM
ncbi:hypothetical protein HID58_072940 [Brassica napus]|uniref:Uncharacterized protein n=1 Tax=Brassica napus TaxID=3708 RepID=A0ABQ7Z628_BRANA|nr:hypothetical protein HID58_072940 [Brassica napus]